MDSGEVLWLAVCAKCRGFDQYNASHRATTTDSASSKVPQKRKGKKVSEMSSITVMSGHVVRYVIHVRVFYLLLGWW
jgi:hypothetical protein